MTNNKISPAAKAILTSLFILAYVGWVAFYLIELRPVVLTWVFQNLGWTYFPGFLHLFLIFSPLIVPLMVLGMIGKIIGTIIGTIKGRPYE